MINNLITHQGGLYTAQREERWIPGITLVLELLSKNRYKTIKLLDVGCGDGSFYKFLLDEIKKNRIDKNRVKYYGVDANISFKKKIERLDGIFVHHDVLKLSKIFNDEFDVVIASDIIEHIDETDLFIIEIKKLLKNDGYIYLTTPNLAAWHCRLMLLFGYQPLPTEVSNINSLFGKGIIGRTYYNKETIHHIRLFTYKALKEFVQYYQLKIVKSIGGGYRKFDVLLFKNHLIELAPLALIILQKNKQ